MELVFQLMELAHQDIYSYQKKNQMQHATNLYSKLLPTYVTGAGAGGSIFKPAAAASGDKSSLVFSSTVCDFFIPCLTLIVN